jgi:hypothetical protein
MATIRETTARSKMESAKSRKVELMKILTTRERVLMGVVQVMPRQSQGSDVIANGSKILIRKRPLFLLRIGGYSLGDQMLGFLKVAAETFVAGEIVADTGVYGRRLGGTPAQKVSVTV